MMGSIQTKITLLTESFQKLVQFARINLTTFHTFILDRSVTWEWGSVEMSVTNKAQDGGFLPFDWNLNRQKWGSNNVPIV